MQSTPENRVYRASSETGEAFAAFCNTISTLRAPGGCPWDRKQTHASIASNMIEEACEAVDAIEKGDVRHMREELGDVLLQVVLQANMAAEAGEFTIEDVIADINEKILRRHPHIFNDRQALLELGFTEEQADNMTPELVDEIWSRVKALERKREEEARAREALASGTAVDAPSGLLDDIPLSLPALQQAQKISKKAVAAGFEWETVEDIWAKVDEEVNEFNEAPRGSDDAALEFGDVLFTLVNVARREHIDAEQALRSSCLKFRSRWALMEEMCFNEHGAGLETRSLDELEAYWQRAKEILRGAVSS